MAQDDQTVANASGAVVRADINANLQALVTNSSGATAPSTTWAYQWWVDTTTGILKQRNAANTAWISVLNGTTAETTTVSSGLAINNATAANYPGLEIQTAGVTRMYFNANNAASYITSVGTNPLVTYTNGAERMRIDSSGNLLVGTTTVGGNGFTFDTNGFATFARASGGAQSMVGFKNGGSFVGEIRTSTTATAYISNSDYRLKEDWQPMSGSIDRLKNLNPVNFAWKVDGSRVDGFLAHEAAEVVPEAVTGEKDAVDKDGNPGYQGIDQSKLVPLLTAALQEAIAKIESLETRIATLVATLEGA